MKDIAVGICICLLATVGLFAADQMVSQVTYFPLSYTGYHNLQVDSLEAGIGRGQSNNNHLGKVDGAVFPLQVNGITSVNGIGLFLNQASSFEVGGNPVTFGNNSGKKSKVTFEGNVRLGTNAKFKNLNADILKVGTLKLGNEPRHTFPNCLAPEDSQHNNMYWVHLKLKADKECKWYLACGKPTEIDAVESLCSIPLQKKCSEWLNKPLTCTYGSNMANANKLVTSTAFHAYCCVAPVYRYALKTQSTVGLPVQCNTPCLVSGSYNENGGMFPPSNGDPLPATFFSPQCNESELNRECILQQKSGGMNYCHVYRCKAMVPES